MFQGSQDLADMLNLLVETRPADRISDYPSPSDLQRLLSIVEIRKKTRLWETPSGRLIAYAFLDAPNNLRFEIARDRSSQSIESAVVNWGVDRLVRGTEVEGRQTTLDAVCRAEDRSTRAMLVRNGFREHPVRTLIFGRTLQSSIPKPQLPNGFGIRTVNGEDEVPALVALHQAAHGTRNFTIEERLAWMRSPDYDPALDLVVTTPEGEPAAYCFCQVSEEENRLAGTSEGWTDPLATHPEYQGQGLGTALIRKGLGLLRERGLQVARLATSSDNGPMVHMAQKIGFELEITKIWHTKPLTE